MLLAATVFSFSPATAPTPSHPGNTCVEALGGPPSIWLAKKPKGDITAAEWKNVRDVDLMGCVADARITSLTFCIKDCKGKDAAVTGTSAVLTKEMHMMVRNLPPGTPFTVKVEVVDGKGTEWKVPPATYVWRG